MDLWIFMGSMDIYGRFYGCFYGCLGVWVSMSVCMFDCGYMSVDGCLCVSLSVMGFYGCS